MIQIPVQCISIVFGIRKDFPSPGVTATVTTLDNKVHSLIFFDRDIRQLFTVFDCTKLHNARTKWAMLEKDDQGNVLGVSGYERITDIAYCVQELSR